MVGFRLSKLDSLHYLCKLRKHRIGGTFESFPVILYTEKITAPACDRKWNCCQLLCISVFCNIRLDRLSITDSDLLGCIGCDTLRSIRHERIRDPDIDHLINEVLRRQNSRICNDRHSFYRTNLMNQLV